MYIYSFGNQGIIEFAAFFERNTSKTYLLPKGHIPLADNILHFFEDVLLDSDNVCPWLKYIL